MQSIKELYTKLETKRQAYLTRARAAASLTIPALFPPEGADGNTETYLPYQGTGARAVKSLASKLLMSLFPPNTSFFQMTIDQASAGAQLPEATKGEIEEGLMAIERMVNSRIEQKSMRTSLFEAFKQLLVGGNVLLYVGKDKLKVYRLDKYVTQRDGDGNVVRTILREAVLKMNLPESTQEQVADFSENDLDDDSVFVYTIIERQKNGRYKAYQQVNGITIEDSESSYRKDACPWIALRMIQADGEDYGRSYVEEHMGDLHALESLSKAILEGSMASARLLFMVRPNAAVKVKDLKNARNGEFVQGNPEDIVPMQVQKFADFQVAASQADKLERAIAESFMMTRSVQRNAERVTAEEIRVLTAELEATLGGVYSLLAHELQLPLVQLIISRLESEKKIQKLPDDIVPKVVTGVDGMGRSTELQKLSMFLQYLQPLGGEALSQNLHLEEYVKRLAAATNLDTKGLVPTREEKQKMIQQQQAQQAAMQAAPEMVRQAGNQ